jgi:hypothetical protein
VHRHIQLQLTIHTRITYLMQSTRDVSGLVDISVYQQGNSLLHCRERHGQHVTVANCCYMAPTEVRNSIKVLQICVGLHYHHGNWCLWIWPHYMALIWCLCLFSKWLYSDSCFNDGCHCKWYRGITAETICHVKPDVLHVTYVGWMTSRVITDMTWGQTLYDISHEQHLMSADDNVRW